MFYRVEISMDQWGRNIHWALPDKFITEIAAACESVLGSDPAIPGLFQQGAIIEVHDSTNCFIGVQVVGYNNFDAKDEKGKKKAYSIQYPFITEKICSFRCRLVCTGVPG
jgi:hypothetical protein